LGESDREKGKREKKGVFVVSLVIVVGVGTTYKSLD